MGNFFKYTNEFNAYRLTLEENLQIERLTAFKTKRNRSKISIIRRPQSVNMKNWSKTISAGTPIIYALVHEQPQCYFFSRSTTLVVGKHDLQVKLNSRRGSALHVSDGRGWSISKAKLQDNKYYRWYLNNCNKCNNFCNSFFNLAYFIILSLIII